MQNLIYLAILASGVIPVVFAKQFGWEANPAFLLKFGGIGIVGAGLLFYNFDYKSLFGAIKFTPKLPTKIFVPQDYEVKDFESITHLRDRCVQAGSEEGLKVCSDLAAILFKLDTPTKD
jgi:hypothetical protein